MHGLDFVVTNAHVITMDAGRRVLSPGYVGVRGRHIALVGEGPLPPDYDARRTVDARGGVCHPGFIDTHAHVAWGLFRCAASEHLTEDEFFRLVDQPILNGITDEHEHLGTLLACVEMLMNGTTCFADTGSALRDLAPTADAVEATGIRGMISLLTGDAVEGVEALNMPLETCLERVADGLARYPLGDGLAWACAGLFGMEGASDELVRQAKELGDHAGVRLNVHKSFSAEDVDACRARLAGRDPLEGYEAIGVLDRNLLLVHFNHCTSAEADLLETAGASVSHCPTASMMFAIGGSRHGRVPELLERGVAVALGTDSTHWGNAWDLSRSVYLAGDAAQGGERHQAGGQRRARARDGDPARRAGRRTPGRARLHRGRQAGRHCRARRRPAGGAPSARAGRELWLDSASRARSISCSSTAVPVVDGGRPTRIDLDDLLARVDRSTRGLRELLGGQSARQL